MINSFENIFNVSQRYQVDMRLAAYMVGVRRVAEASRFRGWI
jgi:glutamate dehydrogenase